MKFLSLLIMFMSFVVSAGCACKKHAEVENEAPVAIENKKLGACICPKDFHPVCGADGKTYSNQCSADCAKVKVIANEPCLKEMSEE